MQYMLMKSLPRHPESNNRLAGCWSIIVYGPLWSFSDPLALLIWLSWP